MDGFRLVISERGELLFSRLSDAMFFNYDSYRVRTIRGMHGGGGLRVVPRRRYLACSPCSCVYVPVRFEFSAWGIMELKTFPVYSPELKSSPTVDYRLLHY